MEEMPPSPVSPTRQMFIELNEAMEEAIRAGFSRDEAFQLIRPMHDTSWSATVFSPQGDNDD